MLVGCYRKDDAANPDVFATALVAILCEYVEAVVVLVTDPRTGIPGRSKWLPSIAEVRHECEVEAGKIADAAARDHRDREREKQLPPPEFDRVASMAKIRAAYPLVFAEVTAPKPGREFIDVCREAGVDPDSIPDRPTLKPAQRVAKPAREVAEAVAPVEDFDFSPGL